jgi:hypothetical protein
MRNCVIIVVIVAFFTVSVPIGRAQTFNFNPNNIITDFELKDKHSMSLSAIQAFLNKHDSVLKNLTSVFEGESLTASEIIYRVAQRENISPKFILTKLDHEQCLVRGCSFLKDPKRLQKALDWAAGFAVCSGCHLSDPKIQKYKGFAKQVDAVASVQNEYIRKSDKAHILAKGQTMTTNDNHTVVPENQATANLYTYTPYQGGSVDIGGNYFFAKLWDKYWGNQLYPDGTILKDSSGAYWVIDGGTRRKFATVGVFLSSYTPEDAITISPSSLEEYEVGPDIKFANYSVVEDGSGDRYLLVNDKKRLIEKDAFRLHGFNPEEVEQVSANELVSYKNAVPIQSNAIYPQGVLVYGEGSDELYWVQNGFKYRVHNEIAELNYGSVAPIEISKEKLDGYYAGADQKIKDGKLVQNKAGSMYMVSQGELRPIESVVDFIELFGEEKLETLKMVSHNVLALHTIGGVIETKNVERDTGRVAGTSTVGVVYKTLWQSASVPGVFVVNKPSMAKITLKNKSTERWELGGVVLRVEETGSEGANEDIVLKNMSHTFTFPVSVSNTSADTLTFKLYTLGGEYIQGGSYVAKIRVVEPDFQARVTGNTMPPAVRSAFVRVPVEVSVKNTGKNSWVRKKVALQFLGGGGEVSPFYDGADWLTRENASVSMEPFQHEIAPGEDALFKFRLDLLGVPPGTYRYRVALWKADTEEYIILESGEFLEGLLRVDP